LKVEPQTHSGQWRRF